MRTRPNNYRGARFSNMDLSGSDFSDANLSGADLSGSTLMGANLRGASLQNANLDDTDFFCALRDEHDHPVFGWLVIYGLMLPDYTLRRNGEAGATTYMGKTPIELATMYHNGDERALAALLERNEVEEISKRAVYRNIKGTSRSSAIDQYREDARQEIAIKWLEKIKEEEFAKVATRTNQEFLAWLAQVAKNTVIDFTRYEFGRRGEARGRLVLASRTYKGPEGEPITLFQDVLDERTFQQQQQQEDYLALYTELALDELNATKPEYAAVLLAGVRGDSDEQIAADLGIDSLVTVRTRKSRARQKLREIIERLSKMGTSAAFRRAANIQREGREETDRVAPIRRRVI